MKMTRTEHYRKLISKFLSISTSGNLARAIIISKTKNFDVGEGEIIPSIALSSTILHIYSRRVCVILNMPHILQSRVISPEIQIYSEYSHPHDKGWV